MKNVNVNANEYVNENKKECEKGFIQIKTLILACVFLVALLICLF